MFDGKVPFYARDGAIVTEFGLQTSWHYLTAMMYGICLRRVSGVTLQVNICAINSALYMFIVL